MNVYVYIFIYRFCFFLFDYRRFAMVSRTSPPLLRSTPYNDCWPSAPKPDLYECILCVCLHGGSGPEGGNASGNGYGSACDYGGPDNDNVPPVLSEKHGSTRYA